MVGFVAGGSSAQSAQGSAAGGYKAAALRPNLSLPSLSTEPKTVVMKNGQAVQSMLLRIALLEDCQIEADGISRLFEDSGYKVVSYGSGATFLKMLENETFDLIVLDWNVPDTTGIEVLHSIRHERGITTPVLMLTSRAGEYDIVQALNRGADDYLQKPWMPFELIARVNALLRRQRYVQVQQDERFSDFLLDAKQQQITRNGKIICLSSKEFLLAQVFLRHLGSPLSRAHITETVWNDTNIETRTVDVHISRLRNKLGLTKENGFNLVAIYGYGYRLERLASPEHPVLKK